MEAAVSLLKRLSEQHAHWGNHFHFHLWENKMIHYWFSLLRLRSSIVFFFLFHFFTGAGNSARKKKSKIRSVKWTKRVGSEQQVKNKWHFNCLLPDWNKTEKKNRKKKGGCRKELFYEKKGWNQQLGMQTNNKHVTELATWTCEFTFRGEKNDNSTKFVSNRGFFFF